MDRLWNVTEIEKRLRIIDSKRKQEQEQEQKKQLEKQQQEQQKQQEQESDLDEQRRQEEFQQSVKEKLEKSKSRYTEYNKLVDKRNKRAQEENEALELSTRNNYDPNFQPVRDMSEQQLSGTPKPKPNISSKFKNKKLDEKITKEQQKRAQELLNALESDMDNYLQKNEDK